METAERYWSGPYWEGVDAAALHAVPLATIKLSSLPSPLLRRIVSYTIGHLRSQPPYTAASFSHLSILNCSVRLPSLPSLPTPRPLPLTVCRLWPAVLFRGVRSSGQEGAADPMAGAAADDGCDYWFGRESGCFIRTARIKETEAIAVEAVAVELGQTEDEDRDEEEAGADTHLRRPP
jgi:hypothetical protein